ncbi:hypothetical protein LCGC14_1960710 [marine sediment metagenome]|uniref:Uncharacterized protein n=1 Tax=marine sediment metagenome TaxID=412755 RepID=A0A0F9HT20_9ZZZZ
MIVSMETAEQPFRPEKVRTKTGRLMSPSSLANLKPYKPGENGHGRVYPLKERLQHALDKPLVVPELDAPAGDHIVYKTIKGAIDLVPVAFKETWDRTEGKMAGGGEAGGTVNIITEKVVIDARSKLSGTLIGIATRLREAEETRQPE